jgi:hypothetical protein
MEFTHVIRSLLDKETLDLKEELKAFDLVSAEHNPTSEIYKRFGGLREGHTVWIKRQNTDYIQQELFSKTISIIENIKEELNFKDVGRVYIHKIPAGKKIHKHADTDDKYFFSVDRFQILLDIPKELKILQANHQASENSLLYFNHLLDHAYENNSSQDFFIYVIDFLKRDVE